MVTLLRKPSHLVENRSFVSQTCDEVWFLNYDAYGVSESFVDPLGFFSRVAMERLIFVEFPGSQIPPKKRKDYNFKTFQNTHGGSK